MGCLPRPSADVQGQRRRAAARARLSIGTAPHELRHVIAGRRRTRCRRPRRTGSARRARCRREPERRHPPFAARHRRSRAVVRPRPRTSPPARQGNQAARPSTSARKNQLVAKSRPLSHRNGQPISPTAIMMQADAHHDAEGEERDRSDWAGPRGGKAFSPLTSPSQFVGQDETAETGNRHLEMVRLGGRDRETRTG